MWIVTGACSTAQAAPYVWANEAALQCEMDVGLRATDVIDTPRSTACPGGSPIAPQLLVPTLAQQYAGYYDANGFKPDFVTWAPVVQNFDPTNMEWYGCNTLTPHPNIGCPSAQLRHGLVSANLTDDRITVLSWGGAFIALVCGNFSLNRPTVPPPLPVPTIVGTKFDDRNGNGLQDGTEAGIGGVTIHLFRNAVLVASTTTAADGSYSFALDVDADPNLSPGTYTLTTRRPPRDPSPSTTRSATTSSPATTSATPRHSRRSRQSRPRPYTSAPTSSTRPRSPAGPAPRGP